MVRRYGSEGEESSPLHAIADDLGSTRERVRQIEKKRQRTSIGRVCQ
jgi:DNA-directed RNA polymerase sigma subunit (sigma70/sigma32)